MGWTRYIDRRGNVKNRARRKQWMLDTFGDGTRVPCTHCKKKLSYAKLQADRIKRLDYRRSNLRAGPVIASAANRNRLVSRGKWTMVEQQQKRKHLDEQNRFGYMKRGRQSGCLECSVQIEQQDIRVFDNVEKNGPYCLMCAKRKLAVEQIEEAAQKASRIETILPKLEHLESRLVELDRKMDSLLNRLGDAPDRVELIRLLSDHRRLIIDAVVGVSPKQSNFEPEQSYDEPVFSLQQDQVR